MGLNLKSPSTQTSLFVAPTIQAPGGSNDAIPTPSTAVSPTSGLTLPVSAIGEFGGNIGALLIPRMTTTQKTALDNTTSTICNGMLVYDTTLNEFSFYEGGAWVSLGGGGTGTVIGPASSTNDALVRWNGTSGINIQDSVAILDGVGNLSGLNTISNGDGSVLFPSYTFTSDVSTGMWLSAAGHLDFSTSSQRMFQLGTAVAAVNYIQVIGSATTFPLQINAVGTDPNIGIQLQPKGTGSLENALGAIATPSYSFFGRLDTGMWSSAAATVDFSTTGGRQFQINDAASAVNWLGVNGSATTVAPRLEAFGTDINIGIIVQPKGTGSLENAVGAVATPSYSFVGRLDTGMWSSAASTIDFSTTGGRQFQINNQASAVNWIGVNGSATTVSPSFEAFGADINIDLNLKAQGTGTLGALGTGTVSGGMKFWATANGHYTELKAGAPTTNVSFSLPIVDATVAGAPLVSDASGNLSFQNTGILYTSVNLTSSNILNDLYTGGGLLVLPNAPAGYGYVIHDWALNIIGGSVSYAAGGVVQLNYGVGGPASAPTAGADVVTTAITGTNNFENVSGVSAEPINTAYIHGSPVYISNLSGAFTTGNGTGVVHIYYSVIPIT
jgi:hypothetical protein